MSIGSTLIGFALQVRGQKKISATTSFNYLPNRISDCGDFSLIFFKGETFTNSASWSHSDFWCASRRQLFFQADNLKALKYGSG